MTAQLSIGFKPSYLGGEDWEVQLVVLRRVVEHLTRKEVAWELNITDQALGDALFERDRKRWAAKWTHIVKRMLRERGDETSLDYVRQLAECDVAGTSFSLSEAEPLTPEEEAAALRRELAKFGDAGKAAVERVAKRKGRR